MDGRDKSRVYRDAVQFSIACLPCSPRSCAIHRACRTREGRVVLTRDTGLLRLRPIARGEVLALGIEGDDRRVQLRQVVERSDPGLTLHASDGSDTIPRIFTRR